MYLGPVVWVQKIRERDGSMYFQVSPLMVPKRGNRGRELNVPKQIGNVGHGGFKTTEGTAGCCHHP